MPPSAVIETLKKLWPLVQDSGVSSAIAGGIALSYWGNPRSTQDVDLAVLSNSTDAIEHSLERNGFSRSKSSLKDLGLFRLSEWVFEPEDHYVSVEVDLLLSDSPYYANALERTCHVKLDGLTFPVNVLSREDLILHKLYAGRLIDQADVLGLLEMHHPELDIEYLSNWTQELGLVKEWQSALSRLRES